MSNSKVSYVVQTVAPNSNNVISSIPVNQEFDLVLSTQDLRPNPNGNLLRGVWAAYIDILFDNSLVKPRTYEVQSIFIPSNLPLNSHFYIRFGWNLIGPISYNKTTPSTNSVTAKAIQTAMNAVLGANKVFVGWGYAPGGTKYNVTFVGYPDTDVYGMACSPPQITVTEKYKGGSVDAFVTGLSYSSNYPNGHAGIPNSHGIHALGGFASFTPLGEHLIEVARVRMVAKAKGVVTFAPWLSDIEHPAYNTLVFGNLAANPPENSEVNDDEILAAIYTLNIV